MNPLPRILAAVAALALASAALAHAMLDRAQPSVGSTVKASPARVELWFSEPLEPAFSRLRVVDGSGRRVDRDDARVDDADRRHVSIAVASLPAGRYRVVWRAVSVDSHASEGDFTFEVAP